MPAKPAFITYNSIKTFIKEKWYIRSNKSAITNLIKRYDWLIDRTISEAVTLSKQRKRKTILKEDMDAAIEKIVGQKHLGWEELYQEVILQKPTDLSKLSKAIKKYIASTQKK